ncbi:MAG: hypothetical protein K9J27_01125 [Bacteroidales bacterium]|nr:hypothetical protein [Bacteroidales bacterium]MCF8333599.1 hypothetical protein [Bacteroidales bacterium]
MCLTSLLQGQKYYGAFAEIDAGMSITYGDVKRYDFAPSTMEYSEIQPGGQFKLGFFLNEVTGLQFGYNYSLLAGSHPEKNLRFLGNNSEVSAIIKLSFQRVIDDNLSERLANRLKVFFDFGYGRLYYTTDLKKFEESRVVELNPDNYEMGKSSGSVGTFPIELTVMFKLNKKDPAFWQRAKDRYYLTLNGGVHFTGSDMVDSYRDREFGNDFFGFYSLGVAYFFAR